MKNIFNPLAKLLSNGRYIKLNGSSYHSSGFKEFVEKPTTKAAVLGALGIVAVNLIQQGSWDITTEKMTSIMLATCLFGGSVSVGFAHFIDKISYRIPTEKKAIDKQGTSLDREELSILDNIMLESDLKSAKRMTLVMPAIDVIVNTPVIALGESLTNSTFFGLSTIVYVTHFVSRGLTAKKLLDGDYVFCKTPPAKKVKEKKSISIFGGATNPSP